MYSHNRLCRARERGFAMVLGLIIVLVITAFSSALVVTSTSHHMHAKKSTERARAHALAEGAATLLLNELDQDPVGPVRNATDYSLSGATFTREYAPFDTGDGSVKVELTYLIRKSGVLTPVSFDKRATPTELYDRLRVTITAYRPGVERAIDIELAQQFVLFDGAILSDATPSGATNSGKGLAQEGHIVIEDKGRDNQFFVDGSLVSNGGVYFNDTSTLMTTQDANSDINFAGTIQTGLAGTANEIPDYTSIGSQDQLFDFDRFVALARAGGGREYTSVSDFVDAMNLANASGNPLEGITVLSLDPDSEGKNPKIQPSGSDPSKGKYAIPGGINIRGTLLFNFKAGTDPMYKVFVTTDLNINPADLSGLDNSNPATYPSGYDAPWTNEALRPYATDISGAGFSNFVEGDDFPALMFNTGIVDIHGGANISGLVYGPSFIEIENKEGNLQYFNGAILGGAGVLLQGNDSAGSIVVKFDRSTINRLATQNAKGQGLQVIGWRTRG